MDRETEKRLRNIEQDIKTGEETLRWSEDSVERQIRKLGSLRVLKFKLLSHEQLREAEEG